MASIVIRSIIIYAMLMIFMRIMGKRQLGELDVSELVTTLLISELAAIPVDDTDIPLLNAVIPGLIIISVEILISAIKNKSEGLKKAVEGSPDYIIYKGRLLQRELLESRISINEILAEMRSQGIGDISDVYYGIIEPNGKLSLIRKDDPPLAHTLIIDGQVMKENLGKLGHGVGWLDSELREAGVALNEVFLMTVTDKGDTNIIRKDGSF